MSRSWFGTVLVEFSDDAGGHTRSCRAAVPSCWCSTPFGVPLESRRGGQGHTGGHFPAHELQSRGRGRQTQPCNRDLRVTVGMMVAQIGTGRTGARGRSGRLQEVRIFPIFQRFEDATG